MPVILTHGAAGHDVSHPGGGDTGGGYCEGVRSERAASGRVARWVLLACTVLGLAAMHTLGHGNSHAGAGHGEPADTPMVAMAAPMTVLTAVIAVVPADVVAGEGCGQRCHLGGGSDRHRDDMAMFTVCLAVLAAFGIAVLLTSLSRSRPGPARSRAHRRTRWVASRAPPGSGAGLRLAAVSVMRR